VNLLILLAIPVYLATAVILVLVGGEYETVSVTASQDDYNQTIVLWYQRFIPGHWHDTRTQGAWECEDNTISAGDRKLPTLRSLFILEIVTTVTYLNTYQIEAIDQTNKQGNYDVSNHMKYGNDPLQNCYIYQINLIPPVDPAESTLATVYLLWRVTSYLR
jgi:hypothetical protein